MRECPFCTGSIPESAAKCKNCGEWVTADPRPAPVPASPQVPPGKNGVVLLGEAAKTGVAAYIAFTIISLIFGAILFLAFFLPQWDKMGKRHEEFQKKFDEDWEKSRQRQKEFDKKFDAEWGR